MEEQLNIAKDTSTRFHPELDLHRLRAFRESMRDNYGGPNSGETEEDRIEVIELFDERVTAINRVIARCDDPQPNAVPCDTFNFVREDAPNRTMTKLGGLPYWPASRAWPSSWRRRPLSFLGQINFRDSLDIVGKLPGEILVMFVDAHDNVTTHWLDPTEEPLIGQVDIPAGQRIFGPQYGVIHRTYDVPGTTLANEAGVSPGVESSIFDLKVGGLPWGHASSERGAARFLFQLESPWEHYNDDCVGFTQVGITCTDWYWPFVKRADKEEHTFEMNWWAAYLKQNGKLRWSWAQAWRSVQFVLGSSLR